VKTFRVRVYEDMYLVDDGTGTSTKVVELGQLESTIGLEKPKRAYPKSTRKRRTKAEIDAVKAKVEAVA